MQAQKHSAFYAGNPDPEITFWNEGEKNHAQLDISKLPLPVETNLDRHMTPDGLFHFPLTST